MRTTTVGELRKTTGELLESVAKRGPLAVTRYGRDFVVIIDADEYAAQVKEIARLRREE